MSAPPSPTRSEGARPAGPGPEGAARSAGRAHQEAPDGPSAALLGSDRLELPARAGRAALARLERLGRPTGPVLRAIDPQGAQRSLYLLAAGTAELVPGLLCWLGWGPELGLDLLATGRPLGAARLPRPRGAEDDPPRPVTGGHSLRSVRWVRVRAAAGPPLGLDLASPGLLRLLDGLAEACARDRLGLPPAR